MLHRSILLYPICHHVLSPFPPPLHFPLFPSLKVLLIRFVTARTATSREVFRVATAAAEIGEPLAIAPAAQSFVAAVRSTLRERGVLMESLEDYPPLEGKVVLDTHFLTQVCVYESFCICTCKCVCRSGTRGSTLQKVCFERVNKQFMASRAVFCEQVHNITLRTGFQV